MVRVAGRSSGLTCREAAYHLSLVIEQRGGACRWAQGDEDLAWVGLPGPERGGDQLSVAGGLLHRARSPIFEEQLTHGDVRDDPEEDRQEQGYCPETHHDLGTQTQRPSRGPQAVARLPRNAVALRRFEAIPKPPDRDHVARLGRVGLDLLPQPPHVGIDDPAIAEILLTLGVRWLRRRGELVRAGDRNQALIIGAGAIARRLGMALQRAMPVTLLDTNRANLVAGEREGLTVHAGSGLDEVVLENAGIERTLRVIAATPNSEVNVLTAQLAVDFGVPDVSVLLRESDTKTFESRLAEADIKIIRAPEDFAGWEHALSSGRAVAETVEGPEDLERFRDASNPVWVEVDTGSSPWLW